MDTKHSRHCCIAVDGGVIHYHIQIFIFFHFSPMPIERFVCEPCDADGYYDNDKKEVRYSPVGGRDNMELMRHSFRHFHIANTFAYRTRGGSFANRTRGGSLLTK